MNWLKEFRLAAGEIDTTRPLVVTLATVDRQGSPRARSVVIRHIDDEGSLWFVSDARSDKAAQIAARNEAEIVCWLSSKREQFRFFGTVQTHGSDVVDGTRLELWHRLSNSTRAMFFWPAPGERHAGNKAEVVASVGAETAMPVAFEAMGLQPGQVERLVVASYPHRRTRWRGDCSWEPEELNP